jgi:hypothetical protein
MNNEDQAGYASTDSLLASVGLTPVLTPTTAVIKVNPLTDEVVKHLQREAQAYQEQAQKLTVTSDEDVKRAVNDLSLLAGVKKAIKAQQDEFTKPVKAHLDEIKAAFESFTTPLEEADRLIRSKVGAYRQAVADRAARAEEINRQAIELARQQAEMNGGEFTVDITTIPVMSPALTGNQKQGYANEVDAHLLSVSRLTNICAWLDILPLQASVSTKTSTRTGIERWYL